MYRLSTDREISTIPRALPSHTPAPHTAEMEAAAPLPANSEMDTGHDAASGNWIYPSQEMFFNAMKRKGHAASPSDMSSIVPIHNAVNEKAWAEIKGWEAGRGSEKCGGPKLVSFLGDSKKLTPKARWNNWVLGYAEPFDRHDWVVDRCGKRIEYVIDFYKGKDLGDGMGPVSFYLDVRPKVNSWEGVRMRVERMVGL
jgi:cytochrome c heme-lyase